MRSYDNPFRTAISFGSVDFGASDVTRVIAVPVLPNGRKPGGRVVGGLIHNITEVFAGSSSDASVRVGDGTDADKYFQSQDLDEEVDTGESVWLKDTGAQVDIENGRDSITVTFVASAGAPTGIANVELYIDWF